MPNVFGPIMNLPMGMRDCRCALFIHQNTSTCVAQFFHFLERQMHANDQKHEQMTETRHVCKRWSERAGRIAAQLTLNVCLSPSEAQWSPDRAAAPPRSGPRELPASGEGGRISALISLSQCDPPTRRGRRTLQDRTLPTRAQVFLNYNNVALELGIMPFTFVLLAVSTDRMTVGCQVLRVSHFWLEVSSKYSVFTGK